MDPSANGNSATTDVSGACTIRSPSAMGPTMPRAVTMRRSTFRRAGTTVTSIAPLSAFSGGVSLPQPAAPTAPTKIAAATGRRAAQTIDNASESTTVTDAPIAAYQGHATAVNAHTDHTVTHAINIAEATGQG